jgi:hypothetical protein
VVTCVDIESIDTDDPKYAPVVKAFDTYSTWALPVVTCNGEVVSSGDARPDRVVAALKNVMGEAKG